MIKRPSSASVVTYAKSPCEEGSRQIEVEPGNQKTSNGFDGFVTFTIEVPLEVPTRAYSLPSSST